MLRITIESVKDDDREDVRTLRTLTIANEFYEGPDDWHGYTVSLHTHERDGKAKGPRYVKHACFLHRKSKGIEDCVRAALEALR